MHGSSTLRVKLPSSINVPLDVNSLLRLQDEVENRLAHLKRSNAELSDALAEDDDSLYSEALVSTQRTVGHFPF